jgi:iron only hydrogenase large subunit-like protein
VSIGVTVVFGLHFSDTSTQRQRRNARHRATRSGKRSAHIRRTVSGDQRPRSSGGPAQRSLWRRVAAGSLRQTSFVERRFVAPHLGCIAGRQQHYRRRRHRRRRQRYRRQRQCRSRSSTLHTNNVIEKVLRERARARSELLLNFQSFEIFFVVV